MKRLFIVILAIGIFAAIWAGSGALAGYEADYVNAQRGPKP